MKAVCGYVSVWVRVGVGMVKQFRELTPDQLQIREETLINLTTGTEFMTERNKKKEGEV